MNIRDLMSSYRRHRLPTLAAAMAYRGLFSLVPLAFVVAAVTTYFTQRWMIEAALPGAVTGVAGEFTSELDWVEILLDRWGMNSVWLGVAAIGLALWGASGVFNELSLAMGVIGAGATNESKSGWWRRIAAVGLVIVVAGIGVVWVVADYWLTLLGWERASRWGQIAGLWIWTIVVLELAYRLSLGNKVTWTQISRGALAAGTALTLGLVAVWEVMTRLNEFTPLALTGSALTILIWLYYAALTVLIGGEIIFWKRI